MALGVKGFLASGGLCYDFMLLSLCCVCAYFKLWNILKLSDKRRMKNRHMHLQNVDL